MKMAALTLLEGLNNDDLHAFQGIDFHMYKLF